MWVQFIIELDEGIYGLPKVVTLKVQRIKDDASLEELVVVFLVSVLDEGAARRNHKDCLL